MTNPIYITPPVAYGAAGHLGNKYYLSVPEGMRDGQIEVIISLEAKERVSDKVVMNDREFKPNELTFFVYIGRDLPETDEDNWMADRVYEFDANETRPWWRFYD